MIISAMAERKPPGILNVSQWKSGQRNVENLTDNRCSKDEENMHSLSKYISGNENYDGITSMVEPNDGKNNSGELATTATDVKIGRHLIAMEEIATQSGVTYTEYVSNKLSGTNRSSTDKSAWEFHRKKDISEETDSDDDDDDENDLHIKEDDLPVQEDEGELPQDYETSEVLEEPIDSFYYPDQIDLANRIVERIKLIYHKHFNKKLSSFKDFDFRIYTANSNMLEKQTWARLSKKESGCLPEELYEGSDIAARKTAASKVHKYHKSTVQGNHDELVREVKQHKDKLFLIVADEAHWGVTTKEQANHKLVNTWNHTDHPNVIVLLVTATPYNLLSDNTRLPTVHYRYDSEKKPQFLLEAAATRSNLRGKAFKKLHLVKWTESLITKVKRGIILSFKVPLSAQESIVHLCNMQQNNEDDLISWKSVELSDEECEVNRQYLIKGDENTMTIKTADGNYILVIINEKVGFIKTSQLPINGVISEFSILARYGEGILLFKFTGSDKKEKLLCYDKDADEIRSCRYLATLEENDYASPSPEWSFLLEDCRPEGSLSTVKEYISLNHYFNSMRYEEQHRKLIRSDDDFKTISNALTRERINEGDMNNVNNADQKKNSKQNNDDEAVTDILTAEYSYFIIIIKTLRDCLNILAGRNFSNLLNLAKVFPRIRMMKIKEFQKALANNSPDQIRSIHPHVMARYLTFLSARVLKQYDKKLAEFTKYPDDSEVINELLSAIVSSILHLDEEDFRNKVADCLKIQKHISNLSSAIINLKDLSLEEKISEIIKESETGYIVDSLILRDPRKADGKMKIIRVNQKSFANRMFKTLCVARQIAFSLTKNYAFEILRDYGHAKLCEDFEGKQVSENERRASYRIRKRLQPKRCTYINLENYKSCDCSFDTNERFQPASDLKCTRCAHMHKRIEKYTDLEGLPCILILVYKGRLGDTFPQSFDAMDLRLCYRERAKKKNPLYLTSVVQEIGRMCRYKNMSDTSPLPYALVGGYLEIVFQSALLKGSTIFACLLLQSFRVDLDRKINAKKRQLKDTITVRSQTAKKGTSEFENTDTHKNRILLYAEPQIGKTGVYLLVTSILRKVLSPDQPTEDDSDDDDLEYIDTDSELEDVESAETEDVIETCEEGTEGSSRSNREVISATCWDYPSKDDMKNGKKLSRRFKKGKYVSMYGEYEYGKVPEILPKAILNFNNTVKCKKPKYPSKSDQSYDFKQHMPVQKNAYKAYNYREHSLCTNCNIHYENKIFDLSFMRKSSEPTEEKEIHYRLSIPLSEQFADLLHSIKYHTDFPENFISVKRGSETCEDSKLKTWIFIPTYNRPDTGNFHFYHTMVNPIKDTSKKCQYISVLVVRSTEFKVYCKLWRCTHAILMIPDTIPGEDRDVHFGGVGFARLAIQIFAEFLELKWIFMLDDNIRTTKDVQIISNFNRGYTSQTIKNGSPVRTANVHEDGSLVEVVVPLFSVLKHLEKQIDGSVQDLESYTGSSNDYGILGVKIKSQYSGFVKLPFKKTHVYSLILLNISRLNSEKIYYKPWQAFEDITINIECDDKNLWVCKYNRFTTLKNFKVSFFPKVFCWNDDVILDSSDMQKAENSVDLLFQWIRSTFPVGEIVKIPENTGVRKRKTQSELILKRLSDLHGSNHLIAIQDQDSSNRTHYSDNIGSTGEAINFDKVDLNQIELKLREYFTKIKQSLNRSKYTLIMLTFDFCIKYDLKSKASLMLWLQKILDEEFQLIVVTSHNVKYFKMEIILMIVEVSVLSRPGTSKTPKNHKSKSTEKRKHVELEESATVENKRFLTGDLQDWQPTYDDLEWEELAERETVRQEIYEMIRNMKGQNLLDVKKYASSLTESESFSSGDSVNL